MIKKKNARAGWRKDTNELAVLNNHIRGHVDDYTANHGQDRRMWSRSLYQRRDVYVFFFQAEDGIRDLYVTGVQTCALPILLGAEKLAGEVLDGLCDAC